MGELNQNQLAHILTEEKAKYLEVIELHTFDADICIEPYNSNKFNKTITAMFRGPDAAKGELECKFINDVWLTYYINPLSSVLKDEQNKLEVVIRIPDMILNKLLINSINGNVRISSNVLNVYAMTKYSNIMVSTNLNTDVYYELISIAGNIDLKCKNIMDFKAFINGKQIDASKKEGLNGEYVLFGDIYSKAGVITYLI